MPRPVTQERPYCLHKPSGLAYVRISGRQVWLGKHGTQASKDKHRAVVAEWVAKGRPVASDEPAAGASKGVMVANDGHADRAVLNDGHADRAVLDALPDVLQEARPRHR